MNKTLGMGLARDRYLLFLQLSELVCVNILSNH